MKMLTHIVIWKYRADVEPEVREEHVALLGALAPVIKEIESLQVGFDVVKLPRPSTAVSSPCSAIAPRSMPTQFILNTLKLPPSAKLSASRWRQ